MKKSINAAVSQAITLFDIGNRNDAINQILHLCKKTPRSRSLKLLFIQMACKAGSDIFSKPSFNKELTNCFDSKIGDTRDLIHIASIALYQDAEFIHGLRLLNMESLTSGGNIFANKQLHAVFKNTLFQSMLRSAVLTNREYDLAMSNFRRHLLFAVSEDREKFNLNKDIGKIFCSSLALQCLLNEHVYYYGNDEHDLLKKLRIEIETDLSSGKQVTARIEDALLVLAMYQPLFELDISPEQWDLSRPDWTAALKPLILYIIQHHKELHIKNSINTLTPINNNVSVTVREHYEANPYPRWISLPKYEQNNFSKWITDSHPHFHPPDFLKYPVNILSAGCGTGIEILIGATTWETNHILAIDLSKSSLAYAIRKSEELGITDRIDFQQADILQLHDLPERYKKFHVITSRGVLHHMEDPIAGLRILLDLLCKNGIMRFALYSELARRHVVKARKHLADNKIDATPENIRRFRHEILLSRHPDLNELLKFSDMYCLSPCRDLLFHTQETRYNLVEIQNILDEHQLQFIGFEGIDKSKQAYRQMFPDDSSMVNLKNWAIFEEKHPDTFAEMYSIIAQKNK